jgi:hypothetical protein
VVSDHDCAAANVRNMNPEKTEGLSPELQNAPEPLLTGIVSLSEQIGEYSEHIKGLAQHSYPKVALLKAGQGRGPLIALIFLLTLEDPQLPQESRRGLLSGTAARTEKLRAERAADAHQQGRRPVSANATGARGAAYFGAVRHRL